MANISTPADTAVDTYIDSMAASTQWAVIAAALWLTSLHTVAERFVGPLAAGYLSLWLGAAPLGPLRRLANEYDLSYGAYIFGWPITQALVRAWPTAGIGETLLAACLLSALAAIMSWLLIERPAMRFGRFKMNKNSDSPAVRA